MTNPASETISKTMSNGTIPQWFLHRHLESFIVVGQLLTVYRDPLIGITFS
jgi:hypothetical protein